jgi:hypothetical protein
MKQLPGPLRSTSPLLVAAVGIVAISSRTGPTTRSSPDAPGKPCRDAVPVQLKVGLRTNTSFEFFAR